MRQKGLTLVDLLVAIVTAMILLGAVVRLILSSYQSWFGAGRSHEYSQAIASVEDLGREIRSATTILPASDESQLLIYSALRGTSRWWFSDNKLWRQREGEEAEVVLGGVLEGRFSYQQEGSGESSTPPRNSPCTVLINIRWKGGSLKTGFSAREWS